MIPPRVGLDDKNLRRWATMFRSSREPPPPPSPADMTRRSFSRMASRKPDAQWVHFRCVQGQRSRTWGPYLSAPARVIHASCSMGPLWPITRSMACNTGISHQECTICSFAVLSPLPKCTGVHYFHASR